MDSLAREVRECKGVEEASRFCRWFQFSGVMKLLELHKDALTASPTPLDPSVLRRKVDDLLFQCGEIFRAGKANPTYCQSDILEINRKLDLLLGGSLALPSGPDGALSAHSAQSDDVAALVQSHQGS